MNLGKVESVKVLESIIDGLLEYGTTLQIKKLCSSKYLIQSLL